MGIGMHCSVFPIFNLSNIKHPLMTTRVFVSILVLSLFSCKPSSEDYNLLSTGISRELADFRKQQLSDIVYDLEFSIPEKLEDSIPASLDLTLTIHDSSQPLYLDFNVEKGHVSNILANTEVIEIIHEQEHVIIPSEYLKEGKNHIEIAFTAGEQSLNRNEDFLYTLLVPDRASTLFPCFDQPNLKATYNLSITAPQDWEVLAGAPEQEQSKNGNFITHTFATSDLMSTYLFSFVAGKFKTATKDLSGFDMKLLYRETDSAKVQSSLDPIFELHKGAVDYLEDYTAYSFPFQKLDFAAIPIFQYGGMEHVGAIQYRESTLFLDQTATESQLLSRAKLIAHETSHMWFGDLVTMNWFNDVWMKEVFANFMADKIVNPAFPEVNHDLLFVLSHYPGAYGEDRTKGANPIRQELDNLKNAGSLYGGIIYHKAPIMMRQLELATGKKAFKEGIQQYIKTYANDNAVWDDLVSILDTKTNLDLKKWSEVWVNQSSRPVFSEEITYDAQNTIEKFQLIQSAEDGSAKIWPQTFKIGLVYADSTHILTAAFKEKRLLLEGAQGLPKPQQIIYNYDGMGYGIFPQKDDLLQSLPQVQDEVARGYSYINVHENLLNAGLNPISVFELYKKGLVNEKNALILNRISSQMQNLYWTYLTDIQRESHQKELEDLVYNQLQQALPANIKKTLFGLFESIAYSPSGKDRLYAIWNRETQINNLKLNEDDYTGIAMQLALFGHEHTDAILKEASAAITNPDKKRRFEFLQPALSSDEATRASFVNSLRDAKNREKESWVLSALNYINHPLRQESGLKHLKTSLKLLEEIQLTGDIFFPKNWLNATIGRYSSAEAYTIRENYLKAHPDLNKVLKNKLLQATDDLERVHVMQASLEN